MYVISLFICICFWLTNLRSSNNRSATVGTFILEIAGVMIYQEAKSLLLADHVKTEVSYLLLQIAVLLSGPTEGEFTPSPRHGKPLGEGRRGEMELGSHRDGAGCTNPCGVSIWATTELMCFCVSLTRFTSGRSEIGVPCPIASLYFTCRYERGGM